MKNKTELSYISFEQTSLCNLNCKYCYNYWKIPNYTGSKSFNSYKQAKRTLRKLYKIANIKQVVFTGGEPLLAERFKELVLYARLKKSNVTIITNGNAGTFEDYKQLQQLGAGLFELPVHSFRPKEHDEMTEVKGSWQKSTETVKQLLSIDAYVVAVIVITKINYEQIAQTLEFIKSLGVNRIMLNRFNIGGQGIKEANNLQLTKEELNEAFQEASEIAKKLKLSLSSNVCTPLCVIKPKNFPNIRFSTCSVDVSKRPLTVDIVGDLRFCNHSPVVLGNIFDQSLESMFESEEAQLWGSTVPEQCADCEIYTDCMAGCRAASQQLNLGVNTVDPIVLQNREK